MTALALTAATFRRLVHDRTALFFLIALPVLVIVVVGSSVSGFDEFDIAVVDQGAGRLGAVLVDELETADELAVRRFDDLDDARTAVRRSEVAAAVVLPAGLDDDLRDGRVVEIRMLGEPANTVTQAAWTALRSEIGSFAGRVQATAFVAAETGVAFDDALVVVGQVEGEAASSRVVEEVVDAETDFLPEGFSYSAPTMLVLFVFITAVAASGDIIDGKRLGVFPRALAAPVRVRSLVLGAATSQLVVAAGQAALLVVVGAVVFGVDWGDPFAAGAIVVAWALVGTGAGLLFGTLFRTADQAGSIGPPIGIALGMLGGCMWPLAVVPDIMQTIGHLTPHAWAVDAWIEVLSRGAGVAGIATQLAVLAAFAALLLGVSSWRLGRSLAR